MKSTLKRLIPLVLAAGILCCCTSPQRQPAPLFKIIQHDRIGYMNEHGNVVIPPTYLAGSDFSEGLVAVRENGLYGFIDMDGKYVIQPAYDYATDFDHGVARVYKGDKLLFINKAGEIVLPSVYKSLSFIDDRKAIITTYTGKEGVIDMPTQKLIWDTIFSNIGFFQNGVAVVEDDQRVAVVGINGDFIVPFGKYEKINSFVDGYAVVGCNEGQRTEGVIDTKGHLLFKKEHNNEGYISGEFYEGFAKMSFYEGETYHTGFINLKGEVVLDNPDYVYVHDFSNGRAFVETKDREYILIDRHFKRIGNATYQSGGHQQFEDGYAIVETKDGYGIIDTMGNYVVKPQYYHIDPVGIVGGYFFFLPAGGNDRHYGVADIRGHVIVRPIISEFNSSGFVNGLLQVVINGGLQYIDKKGKVVWEQENEHSTELPPLNIDFMNRGHFYANSLSENVGRYADEGWANSVNLPVPVTTEHFPGNVLAVTINTAKVDTFLSHYRGYELCISNTTSDTMRFDAQDSRLDMILQAQDKDGAWKDIEYIPRSWCGNSYHQLALVPHTYWRFTIPDYQGTYKTRIRAVLKIIDNLHPEEEKTVYSNIISGSVNPGQFWNKLKYEAQGIMDPYRD